MESGDGRENCSTAAKIAREVQMTPSTPSSSQERPGAIWLNM